MKRFTAATAPPMAIVDKLMNGGGMAAHPVFMDIPRAFLSHEFIMGSIAASPNPCQFLGLNYPYPEVLDSARGGNTEGRA